MKPSTRRRAAWLTLALSLVLVLGSSAVRADEADANSDIAGANPEAKAYVNQYFFTFGLIGTGIFLLCRPSRRKREVRSDREMATATKEGANV